MKECKCKDWKENISILNSGIYMNFAHGFNEKGLKKVFKYCPWCGKELKKGEEK